MLVMFLQIPLPKLVPSRPLYPLLYVPLQLCPLLYFSLQLQLLLSVSLQVYPLLSVLQLHPLYLCQVDRAPNLLAAQRGNLHTLVKSLDSLLPKLVPSRLPCPLLYIPFQLQPLQVDSRKGIGVPLQLNHANASETRTRQILY